MAARILYSDPGTGEVRVVIPASPRREGETVPQYLQRVAARCVPAGVAWRVVDESTLPSRRFRNAWRAVGGAVSADAALARAHVLAENRTRRNGLLDDSDRLKAKLDDIGTVEQRQALATYRQALRDLPAAITTEIASLDVGALEAYTPTFPTVPDTTAQAIAPS